MDRRALPDLHYPLLLKDLGRSSFDGVAALKRRLARLTAGEGALPVAMA